MQTWMTVYNSLGIQNWSIFVLKSLEPCGVPELSTDNFCHDENNNVGCNWDSGACCNKQNDGWNSTCTECKCLGKW